MSKVQPSQEPQQMQKRNGFVIYALETVGLKADIDFESDTIKVTLVTSGYTPH